MNQVMAQRSPSSEAGFALIEVIVAAAVLAIVALAVLSGIDGATSASAREKARAVAANLAEQDQERLRAMPIDLLRNPPQSGDVKVDGVSYQIKSEAKWITDDLGGEPTCGKDSNQVEYLHIITTVTSTVVGKRTPPVTVDSLVAPTTEWAEDHGTLGVRVVDRTSTKGVVNIRVVASSTDYTPPAVLTDINGCAVFKTMPVGSYTITLDQGPYLDRTLTQKSTVNQTVVAKKVSFVTMQYDKGTSARVSITTHRPGKAYDATQAQPSKARAVSLTNGAYVGMLRTVKPSSASATVDASALYPFFENSYTFFTGECGYDAPDFYKPANTNYFTNVNPAAALMADPAKAQPQGVTVRQPPFNIRIQRRNATATTAFADSDIWVYAKLLKPTNSTEACVEPIYRLTTLPYPISNWGSKPRTSGNNPDHWVTQEGGAFDPGMPFGTYKICVVDRTTNRYSVWATDYNNTTPDGNATGMDIAPSSWTNGTTCVWP
jgi:prepilin-type N-terminal cleavage/methylation domain-containing protein